MIQKRRSPKVARSRSETMRLHKLREKFQRQKPSLAELLATGDYADPVPQSELVTMLQLAAELKKARQDRRLSLADVAKRSGIDKAALSRIENGQNTNPTIATLETIARSIGARLKFQLETSKR
jgi:DNA-binding XRE family transcriptional regulator